MGMSVVPCKDRQSWDAIVRDSPQGSVFSRSCYLDIFDEVEFEPWLVLSGNVIVLGALLVKRVDGSTLNSNYPFARPEVFFTESALSAPIHRRVKDGLEALQALLNHLETLYDGLRFRFHPAIDDVRALSWFHYHEPASGRFTINARFTGWIELQPTADFDSYLSHIRPTRRNEYRRAIRHGLTAELTRDVAVLDYLHRLTFDRQGQQRDTVEAALLARIATAALEKNFGEVMLARAPNGEPISATLFLHDLISGHYVAAGNHPDYRRFFGGTFCFLESVRNCISRRLQRVDVCGINSPNRGDFKTSFNAVPRAYFEASWIRPIAPAT